MEEQYIDILTGDFLKNAGIVGMITLLKDAKACEGDDYIISGNKLSIRINYLSGADLTQMYFNSMIERFYEDTALYHIDENIKDILFDRETEDDKTFKEKFSFIVEKLSTNSYKTGISTIQSRVENVEIYDEVISKSFKNHQRNDELYEKLQELQTFLNQNLVHETLCFKSIIYNYVNKFWEKSFLLRNNAKKDMKECYEKDFVNPLKQYLQLDKKKMKDSCIDCGNSINNKFATPISFMKDFADDLSRKKSSLYNFKNDMNLCPVCAFLYSLTPLGFIKFNNDFVFFNNNNSILSLVRENSYYSMTNKEEIASDYELQDKYYKIYNSIKKSLLIEEQKNLYSNIQVISRTINNDNVSYNFDILDKQLINLFGNNNIIRELDYFVKTSVVNINNEWINLFDEIIERLLDKRNLYDLIYDLIKENLIDGSKTSYSYYAKRILNIQFIRNGGKEVGKQNIAVKEGYNLRKVLESKAGNVDENYRGTIYQLTNAVNINNTKKFIDIVIRLYTTLNLQIPSILPSVLSDEKNGKDIAYAFILGLKGAYYTKEDSSNE